MAGNCNVIISASGQCGKDAVPLYEAGQPTISCILELDALGQLTVSKASTDGGNTCPNDHRYGCVEIHNAVIKRGVQAQSGQAYVTVQSIAVGPCHGL